MTAQFSMTEKQNELLVFIENYLAAHPRVAPTFNEMKIGLGLKSKSQVHRLIGCLEDRGCIRRLHGRRRAIELIGHRHAPRLDCPSCDAPIQPAFNFCPECGHALKRQQARAA